MTVMLAALIVAAGCSHGAGVATAKSRSPGQFCVALRDALFSGDNPKHDSPLVFYRGIAAAWDHADRQAPATLKPEVHTVARDYDQLVEVLDQHGRTPTDPPTDLVPAVNRLTGYLHQTCKMRP